MARTQNAQTFTGQPLALQVEYGLFDKQHGQTLDLGFGGGVGLGAGVGVGGR
jgi:hypothetical protein